MPTTAFANSAKAELAQAAHCFNAPLTLSCTSTSTVTVVGLSSTAGISVGMAVTGANVAANTVVASVDSATGLTLSKTPSGAITSITLTGDAFKIALIKVAPAGTYNNLVTNVGTPGSGSPTTANLGTDETSGAGYTSGGFALTNITPQIGSSSGFWSFSVNPSWTSATFSAIAGIIYNNSTRLGAAAAPLNGRTISVHDFGGTQTVSGGTFTILLPVNSQGNALLQIS